MSEPDKTNILPVKHTTYVLQRLQEQRINGLFCDATLIVEGEKFRVHKSFLAANSDYFLSLFTSAHEQQNFVLAGVPLQGFRVLMDFVYTSSFVLNFSNVHDVYKASSVLDFHHVKAACEKVYRKIKHNVEPTGLEYRTSRRDRFRPAQDALDRDHGVFGLTSSSSPHSRGSPPVGLLDAEKRSDLSQSFLPVRSSGLDIRTSPHQADAPSFIKPRLKRKVKVEPCEEINLTDAERTPKRPKDASTDHSFNESNGRFASPVSIEDIVDASSPPIAEAKFVVECSEIGLQKTSAADLPVSLDSDPSDPEQHDCDWSSQNADIKPVFSEPWKILCTEKTTMVIPQERPRTQRNRRKTSKTTRISIDSSDADC